MRLDPIILTLPEASRIRDLVKQSSSDRLCELAGVTRQPVKPDDHSEVVPLLPIPNRTVKRLCADDSADSRVKVGHCQAIYVRSPALESRAFVFRVT